MIPSLGQCAQAACVWEVTARKPGNVHPGRDFDDARYAEFLASAAAIAPIFDRAGSQSVGRTVLDAIRATRRVVQSNTNLGIVLLLAPLAAASARAGTLQPAVHAVLGALDLEDARLVFEAVRLANPGGLGSVATQDISTSPTMALKEIMALAAERDMIARQYINGFGDVFEVGMPALLGARAQWSSIEEAVIFTHLTFMARFADSLILRKRGDEEAECARRLAEGVLAAGWPHTPAGKSAFEALDRWLSAIGNARNPGTSADLVAACLFIALREAKLSLPEHSA